MEVCNSRMPQPHLRAIVMPAKPLECARVDDPQALPGLQGFEDCWCCRACASLALRQIACLLLYKYPVLYGRAFDGRIRGLKTLKQHMVRRWDSSKAKCHLPRQMKTQRKRRHGFSAIVAADGVECHKVWLMLLTKRLPGEGPLNVDVLCQLSLLILFR